MIVFQKIIFSLFVLSSFLIMIICLPFIWLKNCLEGMFGALGFFRTREENAYHLKNFKKWASVFDPISQNKMIFEYRNLNTPEQRLFAAYTSWDPNLKDFIKSELLTDSPKRRRCILKTIHIVFEKKSHYGLSFLLQKDYPDDFLAINEQIAQYKGALEQIQKIEFEEDKNLIARYDISSNTIWYKK